MMVLFSRSMTLGRTERPLGGGGVATIHKDAVCTLGPGHLWCIDGFLYVAAVEVDFGADGKIVEGARKAKDIPEQRTGSGHLIYVETRIDKRDSGEDVIPEVALVMCVVGGWWRRKRSLGWEN